MHRNRFQSSWWYMLLSGWLLMACTASEDKRPDNIISEDRMADILTDVHLAEARVSRIGFTSIDSSNIVYKRLESQIIKKFKVDTAVYRLSYIFYSSHPHDMETIYKRVTKNLETKRAVKTPKQS